MKSISFSPDMMRALLKGRKSQTRRVHVNGKPKFEVGDLVWVKEGLSSMYLGNKFDCVAYKGVGGLPVLKEGELVKWPWKNERLPAMFCPKWASRVTLKITRVRHVPLLPITLEDARAEGFSDTSHFLDYFWKLSPKNKVDTMVFAYDFEVVA